MKPPVLITKRIYPEAVQHKMGRAEVASDEGVSPIELLQRIRGKVGVVTQLTDRFSDEVTQRIEEVRNLANVAVCCDNIDIPAASRKGILVTRPTY